MCTGIEAIAAGVSTAASVGGSIMGFGAQNKSAWEQRAHNAKVEAINEKYRAEVVQWTKPLSRQGAAARGWLRFRL